MDTISCYSHDCMGPGNPRELTLPTVVSVQSRVHVQPCTHETMRISRVAPCGFMEPRAGWTQVAMK